MLEELKKLKDLQAIDSQLFDLEEEFDALPEQNESLEEEIVKLENKLQELKTAIKIQVEEKDKRDEIFKKGEEQLKTITGKQSAIRNKDEYNSLLREIDNIKRFNRDLSDEIAEISKEIDNKTNELFLIEEETEKKIFDNKNTIKRNKARLSELEKSIDSLYDARDKLVENIKPAVYRKYQRILDNSPNGKAIAIADDRVCLGCNMTLPAELYNMVLRAVEIEVCPNCQCILVPTDKKQERNEIPFAAYNAQNRENNDKNN